MNTDLFDAVIARNEEAARRAALPTIQLDAVLAAITPGMELQPKAGWLVALGSTGAPLMWAGKQAEGLFWANALACKWEVRRIVK